MSRLNCKQVLRIEYEKQKSQVLFKSGHYATVYTGDLSTCAKI